MIKISLLFDDSHFFKINLYLNCNKKYIKISNLKYKEMKYPTIKEFNKSLSWETRLLVLLVVAMVAGYYSFESLRTNWFNAALFALVIVTGVDLFSTIKIRYPIIWRTIISSIILLILAMLLIGFLQVQIY